MFKINKLLFFLPLVALAFCFNAPKDDNEKMKIIMVSVKNTLAYLHYSPKPINDAYSQEVYKQYFKNIDPMKRYFLQTDLDEFSKHQNRLDDYLNDGDLTFFNLTNDRLMQRMEDISKEVEDIFSKPINLDEDETFVLEPKIKQFPKDKTEQRNEWKKYIKYNILQEIETLNAREEAQKKKKDSFQKNKLPDTVVVKILTPEQKRIKATDEVKELLKSSFRRIKRIKKMDWFSRYMNAYTMVFDPHTNYFSPKDKEDFDVSFKGSFMGIGAVIKESKGYLELGELTIGAPAWKSKQLTPGDKILKVKSKPGEQAVSVVGMFPDEAVRLIRGKKGVPVTLTLRKKDGEVREVTLIREEVSIEDTFARSVVVESPQGKKYGFVFLPHFNADFSDAKGRNASDDIKAELIKLKAQKVEGIILDLRDNGGGSLTEVGDIMSLFMNEGPYVQIKDGNGKVKEYNSKMNDPIWTGPLVIMQSELSASASEILAGKMQDYGRAVIIGSPQSFGKGTVQSFVDLNRFLDVSDDYGSLKLTIQKFYRVSGESTQKKGIQSDIVMKNFLSLAEIGERFSDYALAWDKVSPVKHQKLNHLNISELVTNSKARLKANDSYQLLVKSIEWKEALEKEETITLNAKKFEQLLKKRKTESKAFDKLKKYNNGLKFTISKEEIEREKKDEVFKKKTENWLKNLQRDIYLQEAVNVISEMK